MKGRYVWWIIVAIILVVGVYYFHYLIDDSRELDFFITLIGASFTILGIAITFDQIRQTRSKAEETNKAVEETRSRMQTITRAFNISDAIRLAEGMELYLRSKKIGESLIKLQEFSQILIGINDEELRRNDKDTSQNIIRQMQLIRRDISSLNRTEIDHMVDWNSIISHVEDAKNILAEHFTKINKSV